MRGQRSRAGTSSFLGILNPSKFMSFLGVSTDGDSCHVPHHLPLENGVLLLRANRDPHVPADAREPSGGRYTVSGRRATVHGPIMAAARARINSEARPTIPFSCCLAVSKCTAPAAAPQKSTNLLLSTSTIHTQLAFSPQSQTPSPISTYRAAQIYIPSTESSPVANMREIVSCSSGTSPPSDALSATPDFATPPFGRQALLTCTMEPQMA